MMPEVSKGRAPGRVTTGVADQDDVMSGGLPPNRLCLVEGEPGSGKTIDSLSEMRFVARDSLRLRRQIFGLMQAQGVFSGVPSIRQDDGVGRDGARL